MTPARRIIILGSTGSIGTQCLDVVRRLPGHFEVIGLAAGSNTGLLAEQVREFAVPEIVLGSPGAADRLASDHPGLVGRLVGTGEEGLARLAETAGCDLLVNALVGILGLVPTLGALRSGTDVALANKESLVVGGDLLLAASRESGARILPVDSEHSGLFQVLRGDGTKSIRRLILTASGGPFRNWSREELGGVGPAQVTDHPTWRMGPKISVDSATMMNKGLEVIEAHHLFRVDLEAIEVLIHPQSIVHGLVEFVDGSVLAQMSETDMRIPLTYALAYPERIDAGMKSLDLAALGRLDFEPVDGERFPCVGLAYRASEAGGTAPAVLSGANERAVESLLSGDLTFLGLPRVVERVLEAHRVIPTPGLEDLLEADRWARDRAAAVIEAAPTRARP